MPSGTRTPAQTRAAVLAAYAAGDKLAAIAAAHGVHPRSISGWARAAGLAPRMKLCAARDAVVAAYAAGEKIEVIALVHGVHPRSVHAMARDAGIALRARGRPRGPAPDAPAIVAAYLDGESRSAVAARFRVSPDTVSRLIRAAGGTMRGRGGWWRGRA